MVMERRGSRAATLKPLSSIVRALWQFHFLASQLPAPSSGEQPAKTCMQSVQNGLCRELRWSSKNPKQRLPLRLPPPETIWCIGNGKALSSGAPAWEERSCPAKTGSNLCRASKARPPHTAVSTPEPTRPEHRLGGGNMISVVPWPTLAKRIRRSPHRGRRLFVSSGRPAPTQSSAQCLTTHRSHFCRFFAKSSAPPRSRLPRPKPSIPVFWTPQIRCAELPPIS